MDSRIWVYVGGAVMGVTGLAFLAVLLRRRWTISALLVGIAHMGIVWLNAAAPFRGLLDRGYVGYNFGFFHASRGLGVTLLAGPILGVALASALIAVSNRPGLRMLSVTATSALFGWNLLFTLLVGLASDPGQVRIELGEFLTIPPIVTIPLLLLLFVAPFAHGIRWSWRRAQDRTG